MVADRGKKPKVADKAEEEESDHIDTELVLSIEKLQEVQDELEKVNDEAHEKILGIEQKYNGIRKPVYAKRAEIIKSIPDFWLTAILSHPSLGDLVSEDDSKIFKYLDSLEVVESEDLKSGYSIIFNFRPNPYFEDTKLNKVFTFFDDGTSKITGTDIKWKPNTGAANGINQDKKGNKRPPSDDSFFSWFSEIQQNDAPEGLQDEIAELIKDDLWLNPLKHFNNDPDEEDSDTDDDEDSDEDDDDDDDGKDDDKDS